MRLSAGTRLVREAGRYLLPTAWLGNGTIVYQSSPDENSYEIKLLESGGSSGLRGVNYYCRSADLIVAAQLLLT